MDRLKRTLRGTREKALWWQQLASGAVAGAVGQTVSYPFDTVRRQMQLAGALATGAPRPRMREYFAVRACLCAGFCVAPIG